VCCVLSQIRRLEVDDPRLYELKLRKAAHTQLQLQAKEVEFKQAAQDRFL
jgi:hypothetical protein